ncbi:MAG: DUF1211 domain-containing protein [Microbacteriaceae bacterium]|nr:DUF1211 domain-containing protein [Microbacteriaceae bacterium]
MTRAEGQAEERAERPGSGSPRRLEALIDGAFAIVMTIVVLEIEPPEGPPGEFPVQLAALAPTIWTFALVFVTLGALWFGNRTQSGLVGRADHPLTWLNLLLVGLVALVPFSARFLITYPADRTAVLWFAAHFTVIYLVHGAAWLYASLRPELLRAGLSEAFLRRSRLATFVPAAVYAVATGLAAISAIAGIVASLVVPVLLVSGLFYRGLARIHARS